jgi:hypothetical protein
LSVALRQSSWWRSRISRRRIKVRETPSSNDHQSYLNLILVHPTPTPMSPLHAKLYIPNQNSQIQSGE